jgi:hypothetical protein
MPMLNTTHCWVRFDSAQSSIEIQISVSGPSNAIRHSTKRASLDEIKSDCKKYWLFVNGAIERGVLSSNSREFTAFYDELRTKGSILAAKLFDHKIASFLWRAAMISDSILADCCVISRWQPGAQELSFGFECTPTRFSKERLICIDDVVEANHSHPSGSVGKSFSDEGEEIYITSLKDDFHGVVASVKLIHWICEHADAGLRLSEDVHYCIDDCAPYHLPRDSVLVLTSCGNDSLTDFRRCLAGEIASVSRCTVIAPSSVIATNAGIEFARKINAAIRNATDSPTVGAVWRAIRESAKKSEGTEAISPEACFSLFYGIYGDAKATVKEQ